MDVDSGSAAGIGLFHDCSSLEPMKLYKSPGMAINTPLKAKKCCHASSVFWNDKYKCVINIFL